MHRQIVIQTLTSYYQLDCSFLIVIHGTTIPLAYQFIVTTIKLVNMTNYYFPTNQYPEIMDWDNLSQYKNLVYNKKIEEKCPLVLYPTEIEGRFTH